MTSTYNYFAVPGLSTKSDLQILLEQVAAAAGYTVEQIQSRDRTADIALVRHIFCWHAIRSGYTHAQIAGILGRHRTAVAHAEKVIAGFVEVNDRRTLTLLGKLKVKNDTQQEQTTRLSSIFID
jgi:chromosomal replication initiation ATPase DnaA